MPPDGYPALQYLQSVRVSNLIGFLRPDTMNVYANPVRVRRA